MELKFFVILQAPFPQLLETGQNPAVQLGHPGFGPTINGGIEINEITQHKADGVADLAIGIGQLAEDILRDPDIVAIILGGGPEPQDLGPVLLDDRLRGDHVADTLGHLLALAVHHKAVGQHRLVRSRPPGADRGQKSALEPAPVLIAPLQIEIGRACQLGTLLQHRRKAHPGVEPDIEDILFLDQFAGSAGATGLRADKIGERPGEPGIGPLAAENFGDGGGDLLIIEHLTASLAPDGGKGNPPGPLAGEAPVGPGSHHSGDPFPTPAGNPLHLCDGGDGLLPQAGAGLIHGDKPLFGGPEDYRFFAAPAVGVAVGDFFLAQQGTTGLQIGNNLFVALEDKEPGISPGLGGEVAPIIHRREDRQVMFQATQIILAAMPRGGVDAAAAALGGDVIGGDNQ